MPPTLSKFACLVGAHKPCLQADFGVRGWRSGHGILYFSDVRVRCERCGSWQSSNTNQHERLPELLLTPPS
jgi:hypothetical protein